MSGAAMISWYDPNAVSSWCASQNACARSREREAAATATAPSAYAKSSTTLAAIRPGPTMPHLTSAAPFMPLTLEPPDPPVVRVRVGGGEQLSSYALRTTPGCPVMNRRHEVHPPHDSFEPQPTGRPPAVG